MYVRGVWHRWKRANCAATKRDWFFFFFIQFYKAVQWSWIWIHGFKNALPKDFSYHTIRKLGNWDSSSFDHTPSSSLSTKLSTPSEPYEKLSSKPRNVHRPRCLRSKSITPNFPINMYGKPYAAYKPSISGTTPSPSTTRSPDNPKEAAKAETSNLPNVQTQTKGFNIYASVWGKLNRCLVLRLDAQY